MQLASHLFVVVIISLKKSIKTGKHKHSIILPAVNVEMLKCRGPKNVLADSPWGGGLPYETDWDARRLA